MFIPGLFLFIYLYYTNKTHNAHIDKYLVGPVLRNIFIYELAHGILYNMDSLPYMTRFSNAVYFLVIYLTLIKLYLKISQSPIISKLSNQTIISKIRNWPIMIKVIDWPIIIKVIDWLNHPTNEQNANLAGSFYAFYTNLINFTTVYILIPAVALYFQPISYYTTVFVMLTTMLMEIYTRQ